MNISAVTQEFLVMTVKEEHILNNQVKTEDSALDGMV